MATPLDTFIDEDDVTTSQMIAVHQITIVIIHNLFNHLGVNLLASM